MQKLEIYPNKHFDRFNLGYFW